MSKANLYKLTNTILSFLIGIAALYYLYISFKGKLNKINITSILDTVAENIMLCIVLIIFMGLNWGSELIKWNLLLKRIEKLSLKKLIESVTLGILLSMITPNRIGELGGRQLHISNENRLIAFYYQSFGAIAQLLITVIMGILGLSYYGIVVKGISVQLILSISILLIVGMLSLFSFSNYWANLLGFFKRKFESLKGQKIAIIPVDDRLKVLLLSLMRYIVFCIQFVLIFKMFSVSNNVVLMIVGLSITFFVSAVIPTSWLSEIAVRSSIILFVFEKLGLEGGAAVISSVLLWTINLLLPSLVGLLGLRKVNWSRITFRKER